MAFPGRQRGRAARPQLQLHRDPALVLVRAQRRSNHCCPRRCAARRPAPAPHAAGAAHPPRHAAQEQGYQHPRPCTQRYGDFVPLRRCICTAAGATGLYLSYSDLPRVQDPVVIILSLSGSVKHFIYKLSKSKLHLVVRPQQGSIRS